MEALHDLDECFGKEPVRRELQICQRPQAVRRDRSGLFEVIHYLEGSCAGPFLSSVGRYEVLDGGAPGALVEITHATIHDGVGPVIEEHPDLEAERAPESFASDPRLRHSL